MKYFKLIWAGAWRKPTRTVFTILSIAVAFLLFGSLRGVTASMDGLVGSMDPGRLRIQSRASYREPLPVAYFSELQRIPGVTEVGSATVFDSYFQDPKNSVAGVAISGEVLETKPREFKLDPAQFDAFKRLRTGAVVGRQLADKFGWKLGDRIPLVSKMWPKADGTPSWDFDIVGIYDIDSSSERSTEFYFHFEYLDQQRAFARGTVNMYVLRATDPAATAEVAARIDKHFANSGNPTISQNERDWMRAQMQQAGDINLIINSIVGAAFFTLLFLTGNTMMQSVRERTSEIAVLKTVGFKNGTVVAFVLCEAILVCVAGSLVGMLLARGIFAGFAAAAQVPIVLPATTMLTATAIAMLIAFISALAPAIRAQRLSVASALAGQ